MKALKVLITALAVGGLGLSSVQAYTVTSTNDSGPGSLREAIAATPSTGGTIDFAVTGTITLTNGQLYIEKNLTILGPGANLLTINGAGRSRVFYIAAGAQASISSLTISGGYVRGTNGVIVEGETVRGGGVFNNGNLTLTSCSIRGNGVRGGDGPPYSGHAAGGGIGGGLYNTGTLVLSGCTLSGNSATGGDVSMGFPSGGVGHGGGLVNAGGSLAMTNCTLCGNSARGGDSTGGLPDDGGGNGVGGALGDGWTGAQAWVVSCTIQGNNSAGGFSWFSFEYGQSFGGGIRSTINTHVMNSIVAGNSAGTGRDVWGTVDSRGYNLIGATNDSSGWVASDLRGSTNSPLLALLGPLQDNGGPTPTLLPQPPYSAAIDNGKSFGLATDQRGLPRPMDWGDYPNAAGGDGSDIGACEVQSVTVDIGLRAFDGTATIKLACEAGSPASPLRIAKNGTTYGILLVATNAPNASKIRIPTASGVKAVMKLP